jgi:hypothetical protein
LRWRIVFHGIGIVAWHALLALLVGQLPTCAGAYWTSFHAELVPTGIGWDYESGWSENTNRSWYRALWVFEVMAIVIAALILTIPSQDFLRREFIEWYQHPPAETLRALREKQHEEFRLRVSTATPFAIAAPLLPFPLFRLRPKSKKSN